MCYSVVIIDSTLPCLRVYAASPRLNWPESVVVDQPAAVRPRWLLQGRRGAEWQDRLRQRRSCRLLWVGEGTQLTYVQDRFAWVEAWWRH